MRSGLVKDDFKNERWVRIINQMHTHNIVVAIRRPGEMIGEIVDETWTEVKGNYAESWVGFSFAIATQNAHMPTNSIIFVRPVSKYRR